MNNQALLAIESPLRLGIFVSVLLILVVAERLLPHRGDTRPARRQANNLALMLIDSITLRLAFPVLATGLAAQMAAADIGLLPAMGLPLWAKILLALLLLDFSIYWQHRFMHRLSLLWRMHRVHHCDLAFDVSLGVRFHPLEIMLSMVYKCLLITLLGAPVVAVMVFEIALSAASLWTHADLRISAGLDRYLRLLIVTPEMHRIHHSVRKAETDSNFGFLLSIWDRGFGTYRDKPIDSSETMPIGLQEFRQAREQGLLALLVNPFRAEK